MTPVTENTSVRLPLSQEAERIIAILRSAGHDAWLVGGAVRDLLCGERPQDEDVATAARPEQIRSALEGLGGRFIDRGGEKYGTVVLVLNGREFEVTTFRADGDYSDGRRPDTVAFGGSIDEDLRRRDFTINAMAYAPGEGLRDPFGGEKDLRAGRIRAVGDPEARLREDPLRMLRGVRFAIVRGAAVEAQTLAAIVQNAALLDRVSRERVGQELQKLVNAPHITDTALLHRSGLLGVISPAAERMFSCPQNTPWHCMDVGMHTCAVIERCRSPRVRLAALLHDTGKPLTKTVNARGYDSFPGHAAVSKAIAEDFLRGLRFSRSDTAYIAALVEQHDALNEVGAVKNPAKQFHSFLIQQQRMPDEFFRDLMELKWADFAGQAPAHPRRAEKEAGLHWLDRAFRAVLDGGLPRRVSNLAIGGGELMNLGITGRDIPPVQRELLRAVLEEPSRNTRGELLRRAEALAPSKGGKAPG